MQLPDLILGYREFSVEKTPIIFLSTEHRLAGKIQTLHRDEADLTWVRVTHAASYFSFKDRVVKRSEAAYDFYRLMSGVEGLFDEAPRKAASWKIEQDSEFEYNVVAYIEDIPTLGYAKTEYGRRYFTPIQRGVWHDVPELQFGGADWQKSFPFESRRGIEAVKHGATPVWKSSRSDAANEAALESFRSIVRATTRETNPNLVAMPDD